MPPPIRRYKTDRISRGNVNGERVDFGLLFWFRDKDSLDLAADAVAFKYAMNQEQEVVEGVALVKNRNISKLDFLERKMIEWLRDAIIDYRRANAEKASVTAELPELPDVS
jgi:hypothetical protein